MTQAEIIAMAREAGFDNALGGIDGLDELRHFAALVAAKERNDCALICENMFQTQRPYQVYAEAAQECAAAIRALGTKEGA